MIATFAFMTLLCVAYRMHLDRHPEKTTWQANLALGASWLALAAALVAAVWNGQIP